MSARYPAACGNLLAEGHRVRPQDSERIRCNGDFDRCGAPSAFCEWSRFEVNGRAGISFWYFCEAHTPADLRTVVEATEAAS